MANISYRNALLLVGAVGVRTATTAVAAAADVAVGAVAVAGADAVAEVLPVALLDELPDALSPVTFEAVSQAAKRNATAKRARSL